MHKGFSIGCAVLSTITAATPVLAQTTDYLAHIEQFKYAARMNTSVASCKSLTVKVDARGILDYTNQLIVDAVKDGISVNIANQLAKTELDNEADSLEFIESDYKSNVKRHPEQKQQLTEKYLDFWFERCARLSVDDRSSSFFVLPDEHK